MILPSTSNENAPLVLDASAIINLLGTGLAPEILALLNTNVLAERIAFDEVIRHPLPGVDHADAMSELTRSGLLLVQDMDRPAREIFRDLTSGDLTSGLDDGEAATIAFAIRHSPACVPVIDERKAANLFARRWTDRSVINTVAILSDRRVTKHITRTRLADAVYSALMHARMRVPPDWRAWVDELIGPERVASCSSLARRHQPTL